MRTTDVSKDAVPPMSKYTGGASLEEVVVPVIELTLKNGNIEVSLVEPSITVDTATEQ